MRGKRCFLRSRGSARRITPAHAGKTETTSAGWMTKKDHPRACGENSRIFPISFMLSGSPPRMRGKQLIIYRFYRFNRITPAHAGKTLIAFSKVLITWDHPRACGENFTQGLRYLNRPGSPPRMRGKPAACIQACRRAGITPAHAGKTPSCRLCASGARDPPRVCGENFSPYHAPNFV